MEETSELLPIIGLNWDEVKIPLVISLWILFAGIAKIGFHYANRVAPRVPECCLLICLGLIVGGIIYAVRDDSNHNDFLTIAEHLFTPHTFFLIILPPIVLEAGYFMPKDAFFNNIGTILTYAIIGTLLNSFATGLSLYGVYKGGLMPGLDDSHDRPMGILESVIAVFEEIHVNVVLYICVFGESLLNDGVAVVLYKVYESFLEMPEGSVNATNIFRAVLKFFVVAGGGTLLGIVFGFFGAFITKYTIHVRIIEPTFVFIVCYIAYLTAECVDFSAILSIVFCGFTMISYVEHNISGKSHTTVKYGMKMVANICEITIFMFLGISAISDFWIHWNTGFVFWTVLFITVYRFMSVYGLTYLLNKGRLEPIGKVDQFVMAYGGLRGGIAFALTKLTSIQLVPQINVMLCACLVVIFFTSFIQGASVGPIVEWLNVKKGDAEKRGMDEEVVYRAIDHVVSGIEDVIGHHGMHWWMHKLSEFNAKRINPIFTRDAWRLADQEILDIYHRMNLRDATKIINKADTGIMLNRSEQKLAELMLQGNSLPDMNPQDSSSSNLRLNLDENADLGKFDKKECIKVKHDANLHHMLVDHLYPTRQNMKTHEMLRTRRGHIPAESKICHQKQEIFFRRKIQYHKNSKDPKKKGRYEKVAGDLVETESERALKKKGLEKMDDIVEEEDLVEIVADGSPESPDEGITLNIDYTSTDLSRTESPEVNGNITAKNDDDTLVLAQTELPWKSNSRISVEADPRTNTETGRRYRTTSNISGTSQEQ
ncbi:Oidioi.mRNA.OKI2018_I69.PAR.g9650.t1.cds [Oikopleura dioica]|uniref:Sodium/hydrogen exchanger n=1 Tax=Oikopleura dioica TaxID=34765 RepID=A0ABN7RQ64_OIKDI|nr:Oidioi.mRNA.OKI2018_I69.PAR.g9650.t1.cds [Oikopleura dioica]